MNGQMHKTIASQVKKMLALKPSEDLLRELKEKRARKKQLDDEFVNNYNGEIRRINIRLKIESPHLVGNIIDFVVSGIAGPFDGPSIIVDHRQSTVEFNIERLAELDKKYNDWVIGRVTRRRDLEIPGSGDWKPRHGWRTKDRKRAVYGWYLNRPRGGNTKLWVRLSFYILPSNQLQNCIEAGFCDAMPQKNPLKAAASEFLDAMEGMDDVQNDQEHLLDLLEELEEMHAQVPQGLD